MATTVLPIVITGDNAQLAQVLQDTVNRLESTGKQAEGTGSNFGTSFFKAELAVRAVESALRGLEQALIASFQASLKMDATMRTLQYATGNAGDAMQFVRGEANRLGLDLMSTASAYAKFAAATRGTTLEGIQTQQVFSAVSKAVATMGLSADDASGVFLALSQMVSKGKVSAEELRQQLGERLPGALHLASAAMGMTTSEFDKAMSEGKILAEDLLPKLAKQLESAFGVSAQEAAKSLQGEINRVQTGITDLQVSLMETLKPALLDTTRDAGSALATLDRWLQDNAGSLTTFSTTASGAGAALLDLLRSLGLLVGGTTGPSDALSGIRSVIEGLGLAAAGTSDLIRTLAGDIQWILDLLSLSGDFSKSKAILGEESAVSQFLDRVERGVEQAKQAAGKQALISTYDKAIADQETAVQQAEARLSAAQAKYGQSKAATAKEYLANLQTTADYRKIALNQLKQAKAEALGQTVEYGPAAPVKPNKPTPTGGPTALQRLEADLEAEKRTYEMSGIYKVRNGKLTNEKKAENDQVYLRWSEEMERAWLEKKLKTFSGTESEKLKIRTQIYDLDRKILTREHENQLAAIDAQITAVAGEYQQQIALAEKKAADILKYNNGIETDDYQRARRQTERFRNQAEQEAQTLRKLKYDTQRQELNEQIDLIASGWKQQLALGKMNQEQELAAQVATQKARIFTIARSYELQRAMVHGNKVEIERLNKAEEQELAKHNRKLRDLQDEQEVYAQRKNGMAGAAAGARKYVQAATNYYENFGNAVEGTFRGIENSVTSALQGMMSGTMSFGQAMSAIWQGIVGAVTGAVAQLVAQWIIANTLQKAFSVEQKVTESTKAAASLDTAVAETWAAYSWIPYAGPMIAMAQISTMLGSYAASKAAIKGVTGYATGGLVDRPTLGLIGEAGQPEIIAPKSDFLTVARDLLRGANIYQSVAASDARIEGYRRGGRKVPTPQVRPAPPISISGFVGSERQLANEINRVLNKDARLYGSR